MHLFVIIQATVPLLVHRAIKCLQPPRRGRSHRACGTNPAALSLIIGVKKDNPGRQQGGTAFAVGWRLIDGDYGNLGTPR